MRAVVMLCLCLALAGCSRSQADKLKHDTNAVGHDIASDVRGVGDNPDLKAAGQDLKAAAHDTGQAARQATGDAGDRARHAGHDDRGGDDNRESGQ